MLTLRVIPPRLLSGGADGVRPQNDIAGLYFDALWRSWRPTDRAFALALSGAGMLARLGLAFRDREAFRQGWDADEQALLMGLGGADAHLGMAARKGLHRLLNPAAYPLELNPLKNKRLFAERCRAEGLAAPVEFDGPANRLADWLAGERAVIVKRNYSSKGSGVEGFRREDGAWISAGRALAPGEAERRIARAFAAGAVVQRACAVHPALAALSPGALPTLRIVTAVNEAGAIEACDRMIRFSAGGPKPVDNFNAGNFVAGLDGEDRVRTGYRRDGGSIASAVRHPATSVAIEGHPVPDVAAAVALTIEAHQAFRDGFRVIGWDVGLTADGPVLIEGNWNPGTDVLRLVSGESLGDSRLGAIYRFWLARLRDEDWRRSRPIQCEPRRPRCMQL
ncbi:sugar-transfer associated ATP-grasp domain-containing protein [Hansschlegelia zhihuaiae]|uniref:Alpha-L-glutamate ligase-related protein ATP-grasp domain-containing protein n=1 Tax=Hansschlegelia zhihuaiae TaxID=405005 RepID=A0A4Q0MHU5_9HYPH|nr:sugar-transfer associated ATP-grasp domain-containing protein [Hansschlegelia zhihuaiae]RXF73100.1 hypothetical protein EK403_11460 [Hansschlegelia zhihuaiae]